MVKNLKKSKQHPDLLISWGSLGFIKERILENFPVPFKKEGFDTHTLYELSVLSCLAYLPEEQVYPSLENRQYTHHRVVLDRLRKSQAYIAASDSDIVVTISGCESPGEFSSYLDVSLDHHDIYKTSWGNMSYRIKREIVHLQFEKKRKIWFTGHGAGAAIAVIGALDFADNTFYEVGGVYTFGMPRVFNKAQAEHYSRLLGSKTFRVVNHMDTFVSSVTKSCGFYHIGLLVYINTKGEVLRRASFIKLAIDRLVCHLGNIIGMESCQIDDHNRHLYARACLKNILK